MDDLASRKCSKCDQTVRYDGYGSWVDDTDGDCCPEDNDVHDGSGDPTCYCGSPESDHVAGVGPFPGRAYDDEGRLNGCTSFQEVGS